MKKSCPGERACRLAVRLLRALGPLATLGLVGCPPPPDNGGGSPVFNNTTDPTNRGAAYVGAAACSACHPGFGADHAVHGHAQILKPAEGPPPDYPDANPRAGVPDPPPGFDWTDIAYLVGGYTKKANFVDQDGFLLTTGLTGVPTQWNLEFAPNQVTPGFVPFEPAAAEPLPYDFECFRCHTTGPQPFDPDDPRFQDGRPGLAGTWVQPGVQCEACHGPGGNHVPNPQARDIYVDNSAEFCGACHTRGNDPSLIPAANEFILSYSQYPELLASGGHAGFACTFCHDPHVSVFVGDEQAIRNECVVCHGEFTLGFHEGDVFVRGDYSELLACESCHMPFATRSATSDALGRSGDTRTHIFRIDSAEAEKTALFTSDGARVATDAQGRAAVPLEFVCLRCHDGRGNAFAISPEGTTEIAPNIHVEQ